MITFETLLLQESELQIPVFTHEFAWQIGANIKEAVKQQELKPVGIRITYRGKLILHFLTEGRKESPWLLRKETTVLESQHSSLYTYFKAIDGESFTTWVDDQRYAVCGGGFPIIEQGEVVGTICVSGLEHFEDHRLITDALGNLLNKKI